MLHPLLPYLSHKIIYQSLNIKYRRWLWDVLWKNVILWWWYSPITTNKIDVTIDATITDSLKWPLKLTVELQRGWEKVGESTGFPGKHSSARAQAVGLPVDCMASVHVHKYWLWLNYYHSNEGNNTSSSPSHHTTPPSPPFIKQRAAGTAGELGKRQGNDLY